MNNLDGQAPVAQTWESSRASGVINRLEAVKLLNETVEYSELDGILSFPSLPDASTGAATLNHRRVTNHADLKKLQEEKKGCEEKIKELTAEINEAHKSRKEHLEANTKLVGDHNEIVDRYTSLQVDYELLEQVLEQKNLEATNPKEVENLQAQLTQLQEKKVNLETLRQQARIRTETVTNELAKARALLNTAVTEKAVLKKEFDEIKEELEKLKASSNRLPSPQEMADLDQLEANLLTSIDLPNQEELESLRVQLQEAVVVKERVCAALKEANTLHSQREVDLNAQIAVLVQEATAPQDEVVQQLQGRVAQLQSQLQQARSAAEAISHDSLSSPGPEVYDRITQLQARIAELEAKPNAAEGSAMAEIERVKEERDLLQARLASLENDSPNSASTSEDLQQAKDKITQLEQMIDSILEQRDSSTTEDASSQQIARLQEEKLELEARLASLETNPSTQAPTTEEAEETQETQETQISQERENELQARITELETSVVDSTRLHAQNGELVRELAQARRERTEAIQRLRDFSGTLNTQGDEPATSEEANTSETTTDEETTSDAIEGTSSTEETPDATNIPSLQQQDVKLTLGQKVANVAKKIQNFFKEGFATVVLWGFKTIGSKRAKELLKNLTDLREIQQDEATSKNKFDLLSLFIVRLLMPSQT